MKRLARLGAGPIGPGLMLLATVSALPGLPASAEQPGGTPVASVATADAAALVAEADREFARGDVVAAMRLLRGPAGDGYVAAQVKLAYYLDYAEEDAEALGWYLAAAEAGDAEAQFNLGKLYAAGEGTERNPALAATWFERSGEQGYPPAIRMLATSYEKGGELVRISYERAVQWLEMGVAQDDLWSIRRLSTAYGRGELGLRIDQEKAQLLTRQANALESPDE